MDKPTEIMERFQKSLEIKQQLLSDSQNDRSLSITLHWQMLNEMNKSTEAMDHFQISLEIK